MSYILDALRKADAERERGAVPGLHAQPASAAAAAAAAVQRTPATGWLIAAGIALVLVLLGWLALRPAELAAPPAVVSAAAPPPAAPPVTLPPTADSGHPPSAATAPTAMLTLPATVAPARSRPGNAASTPARSVAAPPLATASPAAPAASADTRVRDLKDLPEEIRREMPPLTIGGAMYSDNAASRMLIINGQLFHENDRIGPDHVLEQIRLKSAVLRFKGVRYGLSY